MSKKAERTPRMVYLSYYEEYPIYEPAEGGYYYAGRELVWSERMTLTEARKQLKEAAYENIANYDGGMGEYYESECHSRYEDHYFVDGRRVEMVARYIGENELLIIENERTKGSRECGWVPYE